MVSGERGCFFIVGGFHNHFWVPGVDQTSDTSNVLLRSAWHLRRGGETVDAGIVLVGEIDGRGL